MAKKIPGLWKNFYIKFFSFIFFKLCSPLSWQRSLSHWKNSFCKGSVLGGFWRKPSSHTKFPHNQFGNLTRRRVSWSSTLATRISGRTSLPPCLTFFAVASYNFQVTRTHPTLTILQASLDNQFRIFVQEISTYCWR